MRGWIVGIGLLVGLGAWHLRRALRRATARVEEIERAYLAPPETLVPADTPWHGQFTSASELVELERTLLTVPGRVGEHHRRRNQRAGPAARAIAAEQVRQRRNGCGVRGLT